MNVQKLKKVGHWRENGTVALNREIVKRGDLNERDETKQVR